jgi:hypothetical protein
MVRSSGSMDVGNLKPLPAHDRGQKAGPRLATAGNGKIPLLQTEGEPRSVGPAPARVCVCAG